MTITPIANRLTQTFHAEGGFLVDIVMTFDPNGTISEIEAWLHHESCGVSSLMFGVSKSSYADMIDMVEANLPAYVESYIEEYLMEG